MKLCIISICFLNLCLSPGLGPILYVQSPPICLSCNRGLISSNPCWYHRPICGSFEFLSNNTSTKMKTSLLLTSSIRFPLERYPNEPKHATFQNHNTQCLSSNLGILDNWLVHEPLFVRWDNLRGDNSPLHILKNT